MGRISGTQQSAHNRPYFGRSSEESSSDITFRGRDTHGFSRELDADAPADAPSAAFDTYGTSRPGLASLRTKVRKQLLGKSDFLVAGRQPFVCTPHFKQGLSLFAHGPDPYCVAERNLWSETEGPVPELTARKPTLRFTPSVAIGSGDAGAGAGGGPGLDDDAAAWQQGSKGLCIRAPHHPPAQPAPGAVRYQGKHRLSTSTPRVFNRDFNEYRWGCVTADASPPSMKRWQRNARSPF
eukprot:g3226.t1